MKLLFFSNSLRGGGAERVLINITTALAHRGHDVTIALNLDEIAYEVDPMVKIVKAPRKAKKGSENVFIRTLRNIQNAICYFKFTGKIIREVQPEVIITFLFCNMQAIVHYHGSIPIIHSEHNAYDRKNRRVQYYKRFYTNKKFDKVFVLTPFDQGFAKAKGITNTVVMPNSNSFESITQEDYDRYYSVRSNILLCGRVNQWHVKGFDFAIKAFSHIAEKYPEVDIDIAGDGSEEAKLQLEKIADECGVKKRIHFIGRRSDIEQVMRNHKVFLLSSRTEGFPMVLTEAMSQGMACVSYERLASSIINDGLDGLLVESGVDSLSIALDCLLSDNNMCYQLGNAAIKNVARFSRETITRRWEHEMSLLVKCLNE